MRYGCVSPTPEMEDVGHSDSESSDASFEIVSAEGIDDYQNSASSFKPSVTFHDIFDVYPMDADIVARVSTSNDFKMSSDDKVVVLPIAWSSVDQAACVSKLNGFYVRFDVNELPKTSSDQFYQLCYCKADGIVVGVSAPFFFREVHEEDLMEFQKEQNKEFWTFRSRFAVLTDLYWNAVKNNGATRPDEMTKSCSIKESFEAINLSSIESVGANKDVETIDKVSDESCSLTKDSETSEKSVAENGDGIEVSDTTEKSFAEDHIAITSLEILEKPSAENCSLIGDSNSTEQSSALTVSEKNEDPVHPQPECVNQNPIPADQKVSESSDRKSNDNAGQVESKTVPEPMYEYHCAAEPRKSKDGFVSRYMDVGPWKLLLNDSFYERKQFVEPRRQEAEPVDMSTHKVQDPRPKIKTRDPKRLSFKTLRSYNLPSPDYEDEIEMQFSRNIPSPIYTEEQMKESNYWSRFIPSPDHHYSKRGKNYQPRVRDFWSSSDYKPRYARYSVDNQTTRNFGPSPMRKTNEDKSIVTVADFKTLPEPTVGKLILEAMNCLHPYQLASDILLCEARRRISHEELLRENRQSTTTVSNTILSLTSKVEEQATSMQNLRTQLEKENKTIETLREEYLLHKKEMETRLKHCAKEYAKMIMKVRHLLDRDR